MPTEAPQEVWDEINDALEKEAAEHQQLLKSHIEDYEEETGQIGEPPEDDE